GGASVDSLVDAFDGASSEVATVAPGTVPLPAAAPDLSEREVAILRLLAAGRANKGIAKDLGLSPNTVKWYLKGLFEKLHANGRAQAVSRAKDAGLL
ncbi:MAG: helix-turn-helix transcriptional regulator, partial [Trueperaceae bacterium]|nr:helix-turn-helix transcriptional regulator [Trueperaceae bacterium]